VKRQRKTLPRKADNAEVVGLPSHDDSEGIPRILTEDSTWGLENCPKSYVKYRESRRRNQERLQVQSPASKSLNMDITSWHRHTAQSEDIKNKVT